DLHLLPIAGAWREGSAPQSLQVSDPYNGETLLQIKQATRDDLDEAYQAAQRAQVEWAMIGPGQRSAILHRAVQIFDERREEIIGWIIRESGSTRIKAQIEWGAARSITLESASFPARVHGRILPSNVPGKENRVYREPLGVVGVISPWNFPLHLTQRSVAPALALGNA
ncbi:aldehyde dehydrogenase family protein, partial [Klebsiella pneumoniae]